MDVRIAEKNFLPVFSLDWSGLLKKLENIEGEYGILAPITSPKTLLNKIRQTGKLFFIDSGVFDKLSQPWHLQLYSEQKC